jgi:putative GTP pyrophosphokinase
MTDTSGSMIDDAMTGGTKGSVTEYPPPDSSTLSAILSRFDQNRHEFDVFMNTVAAYIGKHPNITEESNQVIHSFKMRLKNRMHLEEKVIRKYRDGRVIDENNVFDEITDLAGVRILHLFQEDFSKIDDVVRKKVDVDGDWFFSERPKAYTWDPEAAAFFQKFDLDVQQKDSAYTSVHYLVRPRERSPYCCEIQVRTLFEEIWGEVDHKINYPKQTEKLALREQIKVLSKITGAGSRLLDSINRVHSTL